MRLRRILLPPGFVVRCKGISSATRSPLFNHLLHADRQVSTPVAVVNSSTIRRFHTSIVRLSSEDLQIDENTGTEKKDFDAADAYEDQMLMGEEDDAEAAVLRDMADDGEYVGGSGDADAGDDASGGASRKQLIEAIQILLPTSGDKVPLTSITPGLPVELICDEYGSVLNFLREHAADVIRVDSDAEGRNMLSLAKATSARGSNKDTTRTKKEKRRVVLQPIQREVEPLSPDDPLLDAVATQVKGLTQVLSLSSSVPKDKVREIRSRFGSVVKFLRVHHEMFDVSTDGMKVAPKGELPPGLLRPIHFVSSADKKKTDFNFSDDEWFVELDLEEDDAGLRRPGDSLAPPTSAVAGSFTGAEMVPKAPHGGLAGSPSASHQPSASFMPPPETMKIDTSQFEAKGESKPSGPAAPPLPKVVSGLSGIYGTPSPLGTSRLEAAHSSVAKLRGWRTPSEMLSLFVECVPASFHVNIAYLRPNEELKEAMGRGNSWQKIVKVYGYYFDVKRPNSTTIEVKIRDAVKHPRKGVADELYNSIREMKLSQQPEAPKFPTIFRQSTPEPTKKVAPSGFKWGSSGGDGSPSSLSPPPPGIDAKPAAPPSINNDPIVRHLFNFMPNTNEFVNLFGEDFASLPESVLMHDSLQGDGYLGLKRFILATPEVFTVQSKSDMSDLKSFYFKLRPIDVAPGCSALYSPSDSPLLNFGGDEQKGKNAVKELEEKAKPNGVWLEKARVWSKLSAETKEHLTSYMESLGQVVDMETTGFPGLLRQHGKWFWVSPDGGKLRVFKAHPDLDDGDHFIVAEVLKVVRALATVDTPEVSLQRAVDALPKALQPLLNIQQGEHLQQTVKYLQLHPRVFHLTLRPDGPTEVAEQTASDWQLVRAGTFRRTSKSATPPPTAATPSKLSAGPATEKKDAPGVVSKKKAAAAQPWSPVSATTSSWGSFGRGKQ